MDTKRSEPFKEYSKPSTYVERNQRWLVPFIGMIVLLIVPMLLTVLQGSDSGFPIPQWLFYTLAVFSALLAGINAVLTDTTSARAVRIIVSAGALLWVLLKTIEYLSK